MKRLRKKAVAVPSTLPPWVKLKIAHFGRPAVKSALHAAFQRRLNEEIYGFTRDLPIPELQQLLSDFGQ